MSEILQHLSGKKIVLSPKQKQAIVNSTAKINIWCGAVRSGKSFSATLRFLIEVEEAPPGDMAIICRDQNAFRRNVLPILRDLIGMDADYKAGISVIELWGRKVHIVGCHDQRSEGKLRGCTLQAALVDEATIIPETSWVVLLQRIAMNHGRIFATCNPDGPMHWLKKDFIDDNPDTITFNFGLLDNPCLEQEDREFLERQHKGIFYRRFIAGEWCLAEGAVFDFFDEKQHVLTRAPTYAKFFLVGVDMGTTNPTAFTMISYNDSVSPCLFVEKEFYWKGRPKTNTEFAVDLIEFCQGYPVKFVYLDPSAASMKIELRRQNFQPPLRDANNDVLNGIQEISNLLSNGDLKINSSCRELIKELQSYVWDPKASAQGYDAPIKQNDHLTDSLRYGIYSYFGHRLSLKDPTPEDLKPLRDYSNLPFGHSLYGNPNRQYMRPLMRK